MVTAAMVRTVAEANSNLSSQLWKRSSDGSVWAPLFATAREIHNEVGYGDQLAGQSKDDLVAEKLRSADKSPEEKPAGKDAIVLKDSDRVREDHPGHIGGLTKRIKENGYDWSKPVEVHSDFTGDTSLRDGHHRVAVMLRDRPDEFIPISNTHDGPPTTSEKALDEHFFNDVARRSGLEEAKRQMPLEHYPWLEHLHNPK